MASGRVDFSEPAIHKTDPSRFIVSSQKEESISAWVKVFRINPEFMILRLTSQRKSASIS